MKYYFFADGKCTVEYRNQETGKWITIEEIIQERRYETHERRYFFGLIKHNENQLVYMEPFDAVRKRAVDVARYKKEINPGTDIRVLEYYDHKPTTIWENNKWRDLPEKLQSYALD